MKIDLENLPDDPALLQKMLLDLLITLKDQRREIDTLKHQLSLLQRHRFGRRSEQLNTDQLLLAFAELEKKGLLEAPGETKPVTKPKESKKGHGRKPLPQSLPRERIENPLPEKELSCPQCGTKREPIGEEITEQLEYVPATFHVKQYVRIKYACKQCEGEVVISPMPPMPIDKGLPGPGLLSHILVSKYADHLPLHRQEEMLRRQGIDLRRSTLCDWVGRCAELLKPVYERMKEAVLCSKKIHTDDTPVPVQVKNRNQTRKGRLWVYVGDEAHPHTVYDYTKTRNRDGPAEFLKSFSGFLQADAYAGYDHLYRKGKIVEVACWAHGRRKFFDAKVTDAARSTAALAYIARLYEVEKEAQSMEPSERHVQRQARSRPLLEDFQSWLLKQRAEVLPKSPMGEAISYVLSNWKAFTRYLDDPDLAIDNNLAERALRCVAVGRKNWLFAGNDEGGRRAAIIYSLICTCKAHGIDPFSYLRDVLNRISTHPASRIDALLPHQWKAIHNHHLEKTKSSVS